MRRTHKKTVAIVIGLLMVVAGAGAAYAYWSAGGAGTGTATTGDGVDLVAQQTSTPTGMGPGVAAQPLSGNFDNGNDAATYVGSVTASIDSVTPLVNNTCADDNYTITDPEMVVDAQVPAGDGQGAWSGATIEFVNSATVNQDGCKGATVTIAYTIDATPPV